MSGRTGEVKPLVVNGWTLFAHPTFLEQLDALTAQVERLSAEAEGRPFKLSDEVIAKAQRLAAAAA